jgi:uncharacterized protein (TIGR02246 family)
MTDETKPAPARDPQDLAKLLVARQNEGDAESMAALYEPQAVLDCGGGRLARGRDEIREFYRSVIARGVKFVMTEQRPALVAGDVALTSARTERGGVTAEIARRQCDGTWLWAADQPSIA